MADCYVDRLKECRSARRRNIRKKSGEKYLLGVVLLLLGCRTSQPSEFWRVGFISNGHSAGGLLGNRGSVLCCILVCGGFPFALWEIADKSSIPDIVVHRDSVSRRVHVLHCLVP